MRPCKQATLLLSLAAAPLVGCYDGGDKDTADPDTDDTDVADVDVARPDVRIVQDAPTTVDDLQAEVTNPVEGATYTYTWRADGAPRPDVRGDLVPAIATVKGQTWSVSVVAVVDGVESRPGEAEVTIRNAPPLGEVTITPEAPGTLEPLVAEVTADDPDNDPVTWTFSWKKGGVTQSITQPEVPAISTARGDTWEVTAIPNDGEVDGPRVSATVVVGNTLPEAISAELTPILPRTSDPLVATARAVDVNGDRVTFTYRWFVDGLEVSGQTASTLPPEHSAKGQRVNFLATPNDPFGAGAPLPSNTVTIQNTPPSVTSVTLGPEPANAQSVLVCAPQGWADADEDPEGYLFQWLSGSSLIQGATEDTLDGSFFERGETIRCRVIPTDGQDAGVAVDSNAVAITNTPPTLGVVRLSNTSPAVSEILTATPVDPADADGDRLSFETRWFVDGQQAGTGGAFGGNLLAGSRVYAEVRASDGFAWSPWVRSELAVVANRAPTVDTLRVQPAQVFTNTPVSAFAEASDPDGHPVNLTYTWKVNGGPVQTGPGTTLSASFYSRGDQIVVTVTPNDGFTDGAERSSRPVLVLNTPPSLDRADISPLQASETTPLTCAPGTFTDIDGDTVVPRFAWYVDGALAALDVPTLSGDYFQRGQAVRCRITPFDGEASGTAQESVTVVVGNTPPVLSDAVLSNYTPTIGAPVTAVPVSWSDVDGDPVTFRFQWYVDGQPGPTTATVQTTGMAQGTELWCDVTPHDGLTTGAAFTTPRAVVQNTSPQLVTVGLSPETPTTVEEIVADWVGTDPDGDPLTATYVWQINGVVEPAATGDTLDPSFTQKDDVVQCEITVSDGAGTSASRLAGPSVVINSPPTLESARISPTEAYETTQLVCIPEGWEDVDGDSEGYLYQWFVRGLQVGTGPTLGGRDFRRDDPVVCRVTPRDGDVGGIGPWVESAPVVIRNSPPVVASLSLSTDTPTELIAVEPVTSGASDPDGDVVAFRWDWYVNQARVSGSRVLSGASFDKGDEVYLVAWPSDGTVEGAPLTSETVIVGNTPPQIDELTVGPPSPSAMDDLYATVVASDLDAVDVVDLTYTWFVDGFEEQSGPSDRLPSSFLRSGSRVSVVVTPHDGIEAGEPFESDTITIDNSPPSITGVVLDPTVVYETTTVRCVPQGWSDPDGDPEGYRYRWLVNGALAGGSATLTGARFNKNQTITCVVTPFDGTEEGAAQQSAPVTVLNSPPVVTRATLSQIAPTEATSVGVVLEGALDADSDPLTITYQWFVNGVPSATTDILTPASFAKHDELWVVVTLSDGVAQTAIESNRVRVANSLPRVTGLTIAPSDPVVTDTVTSTWGTVDLDGDPVTVTWRWYADDVEIPGQSTDRLPPGAFRKHQQLRLVGTPHDGEAAGAARTSNLVTAINSPPVAAGATISPLPVTSSTSPTCVAGALSDADGDPVVAEYEWSVDGAFAARVPSLPSTLLSRGEVVACAAVPFDGEEYGSAVSSEPTTVVNSPPTLGGVSLSTTTPVEGGQISAQALDLRDADGDLVEARYSWLVNGVEAATTRILDSTRYARGDVLQAVVTPWDGFTTGAPRSSIEVTVVNRPPTLESFPILTPTRVFTDTTVHGEVEVADADLDPVQVYWAWDVGGVRVAEGFGLSDLPGTYFARGQTIRAVVTPYDGYDYGESRTTATVTVLNSKPTAPTVAVTPTRPRPGIDNIVCSIAAPSVDADGTAPTYQFRWRVDDVVFNNAATTGTTSTINASIVGLLETWICEARAYDGIEWGPWSAGAVAETGNPQVFTSCQDHLRSSGNVDGIYLIDPDGGGSFEAYCDQSTAAGGWTRILRTTTYGEFFGQSHYNIVDSFVAPTASAGVYEPFRRLRGFDQIMIKQVSGAQAGRHAAYSLSGGTLGLTMLEIFEVCRDEPERRADDSAFAGSRTVGHTAVYSGQLFSGNLQVWHQSNGTAQTADNVLVCGVNYSSDNDVSYLAFTARSGQNNDWGDSWRGEGQVGTIWSFANADYCCAPGNHIGYAGLQGYAGWKGVGLANPTTYHQGAYEIYVR